MHEWGLYFNLNLRQIVSALHGYRHPKENLMALLEA
jgi:hypothetical protein